MTGGGSETANFQNLKSAVIGQIVGPNHEYIIRGIIFTLNFVQCNPFFFYKVILP